jgi:hypothetical protein
MGKAFGREKETRTCINAAKIFWTGLTRLKNKNGEPNRPLGDSVPYTFPALLGMEMPCSWQTTTRHFCSCSGLAILFNHTRLRQNL